MKWAVVYKSAVNPDGSLLFPELLSHDYLRSKRKELGSYKFANQYLNEVIPEEDRKFKREWLRYHDHTPENVYTFGFIDPAISQKDHSDFTAFVWVDVDHTGHWYVNGANRYKITPTQTVNKVFEFSTNKLPRAIGVESVAYQEALIYLIAEEMNKRKVIAPVKEIKRSRVSKNTRIEGLVPRLEWGKMSFARGLNDLEDELFSFPRGSHDDLLDALASLEEIVYYPETPKKEIKQPASPSDPTYESWYIQQKYKQGESSESEY